MTNDMLLLNKIKFLPDDVKYDIIRLIDDFYNYPKIKKDKNKRLFGFSKGSVIIPDNFDDPIDDFKDYM